MQAGAIGYDITANPTRASQFTYDANGNRTSTTDALGRVTLYSYNSLGQKTSSTEPVPYGSNLAPATTAYTYDALGRLTETDAPLGLRTIPVTLHRYIYAGSNPVGLTDPSGRDLAEYGIRLHTSFKATNVLGAISCGVAIGSSLSSGSLQTAFGDVPGDLFTAFGCVTSFYDLGHFTLASDVIGIAGCYYSLYQTYEAETDYFADPTDANYRKVTADLIGAVGGCALTGIAPSIDLAAP